MADTTNYESFYSGGYSSFNPDSGGYVGYRLHGSAIGSPTSIQTANQLNEVISRIREGVKNVELQPINPEVFEQIPKQHFKEIAALSKLTGVKPSVHSPIIDPVGFGERGWEGDAVRESAERRLFSVIEKSHELDPNGNIPVVIHSSGGVPGTDYVPDKNVKPGEKGRFKERMIIAIDQESKQLVPIEEKKEFIKEGRAGELQFTPEGKVTQAREILETENKKSWEKSLANLAYSHRWNISPLINNEKEIKQAEEKIKEAEKIKEGIEKGELTQEQLGAPPKTYLEKISKDIINGKNSIKEGWNEIRENAKIYNASIENDKLILQNLVNVAFKWGTDEQRKNLMEITKNFTSENNRINSDENLLPEKKILNYSNLFKNYLGEFQGIIKHDAPQILKPLEEFAMDKAAETFGNVAFKSYEKFKENAPIMAVENMYQGMAFSRAEDMENLIKKSREVFVKNAVENGLSKDEAKNQAEKLIGATWDVGHLNILRKSGFTEEDIVKETEKVAKLVKHIHLTDNFGYSDSHLPPGMGNVPFKRILETLEKHGKLGEMRAIVEAGSFVQHFKKSPHPYTLAAFGSPIYGAKMAPYWNQAFNIQGGYFGTPMAYLPEKHFSMYGSGFSMLPGELGGQIPGTQSRFAGTPNA